MFHFKPFSPHFHDGVNLFPALFLFLDASIVVVSHPSVDSPIDIHLSKEKRVARNFDLTRFSLRLTQLLSRVK